VPAAAVIPEQQALFGVIGCRGCVGGTCLRKTKLKICDAYAVMFLEFKKK